MRRLCDTRIVCFTGRPAGDPAQPNQKAVMDEAQALLPLFYRQPEALQPERHRSLGLDPDPDFSFAAKAVSVPISAAEASLAARHYPIVFASAGQFLPLAVTGLRQDENLFVEAGGRWRAETYVPAYVRRYPFIFAEDGGADRMTLCIERTSARIVAGGDLFFAAGEPTPVTRRALDFCAAFEREIADTKRIVELFRRHGLLTPNEATLTLPSGAKTQLRNFLVIDAKAVNELGDAAFLELRRASALPLLFAQIASRNCWGDLVARLPAGDQTSA